MRVQCLYKKVKVLEKYLSFPIKAYFWTIRNLTGKKI